MKLLFFLVACSQAQHRCDQQTIDEGKDYTKIINTYYNVFMFIYIKIIPIITLFAKVDAKRRKYLQPMPQGKLFQMINLHAVDEAIARPNGLKIDFMRNPIFELAKLFFVIILKFISTPIFKIKIQKKILFRKSTFTNRLTYTYLKLNNNFSRAQLVIRYQTGELSTRVRSFVAKMTQRDSNVTQVFRNQIK